MDRQNVKEFLEDLTGNPYIKLKDQGEWVMTSCPLAPWTHEKGTDSRYSFGIKVNESDQSVFNCLGCKSKGTLAHLAKRYQELSGEDLLDLIEEVENGEFLGGKIPAWDARRTGDTKYDVLGEPLGEEFHDMFDPVGNHPYLVSRGVTPEAAEEMGLGIDPDDNGVERIIFPVRDLDWNLYGYSGRATTKDAKLRVKDYYGLKKRLLLLGAEFIDPEHHPYVILVEGLFDYAKMFTFGFPAVAVMHSGLTDQQADILKDIGLPVIIFFDNDEGGRSGAKVVKKQLSGYLPLMGVNYPHDGASDPGDLSESEIENMVENAFLYRN